MLRTRYSAPLLLLLTLALSFGCARVAAPEGGPKDITPPKVLKTKPENGSTNIKPEKIRIYFNEYAQVKDAAKEFYVSPPLQSPLLPVVKGRSIEFSISDSLRDHTTYVLNFGRGLVDLTEGNVLEGYRYVFSTGDSINHGSLSGQVRNAYTQEPVPNIFAMLYLPKGQTPARDTMPDAIAKTDTLGFFHFSNVPMQPMAIVALNDMNSNFRYDQPSEDIAFLSDMVQPTLQDKEDTITHQLPDSATATRPNPHDSTAPRQTHNFPKDNAHIRGLVLDMFSRAERAQMLIASTRPLPEQLRFVFSCPPKGEVAFTTVAPKGFEYVQQTSPLRDTIDLWLTDSATALLDTLRLQVSYLKTDSLQQLVPALDTVALGNSREEVEAEKTKDKEASADNVKLPPLPVRLTGADANALRPNDTLWLVTDRRIDFLDTSKLHLLRLIDSAQVLLTILRDTLQPNALGVAYPWAPDTTFVLQVRQGAFRSLLGLECDSLEYSLKGLHPSDFSAIHLKIFDAPSPCLLQLYSDKKTKATVYQAIYQAGDSIVTMPYLMPGIYGLRLIHDINGDGQWTTGNYDTGLQPEPVKYFRDPQGATEIKVRRNWEYDIEVHYNNLPK